MISFSGDHLFRWQPGKYLGDKTSCIIISDEHHLAVDATGFPLILRMNDPRIQSGQTYLIGTIKDTVYFACRVSHDNQFEWSLVRSALIHLPNQLFTLISSAIQILHFHYDHAFCGRCGNQTIPLQGIRGLQCIACEFTIYPRISPSIIVLITRGDYVLLANAPRFKDGMYSTLAGYVEAGESSEHACHREIYEEVGVHIEDPIYQGSQSWPFKHSLMLGYRAAWKSGEIKIDKTELADAQWFHLSTLPKLPPHASIARGLIDTYRLERGF